MSGEARNCRARIVPALSEIAAAIAENLPLDDIMDCVVRALVEHLPGTRRVLLTIVNRMTGQILIERAFGVSDAERLRGVYRLGEGVTGKVVQSGRAMIVPDISRDPSFLNRTGSMADGIEEGLAYICAPVKLGREVMGAIGVDRPAAAEVRPDCPEPAGTGLERDLEVISVICAMIAQAVRLHKEMREEESRLKEENRRLNEELAEHYRPSSIIGNSKPMLELYRMMEKVHGKDTPVLILGETGCGKELVAHALHYNSPRKDGPFIKFNCAAMPESLAESELFGHERGAFTGAVAGRKGRFELADGGTMFLDEIGELSPNLQAKLLRVIQQGEFERVGGERTLRVDLRLIAATHRDLGGMISAGTFREDLFYRLSVFPLNVPPLRDRGSDILLLADHFVEVYAKRHGSPARRISSPSIEMLLAYHWPGNVRELENAVERAVILADDGVIHSYHLPPSLQTPESSGTKYLGDLERKLEQVEKETIVDAIKAAQGNMARAARDLGLTERVMALRMRKHGIDYKLYRSKADQG